MAQPSGYPSLIVSRLYGDAISGAGFPDAQNASGMTRRARHGPKTVLHSRDILALSSRMKRSAHSGRYFSNLAILMHVFRSLPDDKTGMIVVDSMLKSPAEHWSDYV